MHDEIEKTEKPEKTENPNLPESAAPTENDARLILLYEIGRILASAETMNAAAPQILEAICRSLHFQLGELWCLGKNENVLRCENDWHFPSPDVEKFLAESRRFEFAKGEGLPGQVWEKGEPVLIKNYAAANFPRQPLAIESELRGAFAFPILLGKKTLGVFNFFSREILQPDELLLQMFVAVSNHVGQFIKREKIESNLRE
ncbi:MAG: GAF domain-containing protein, partial [Pyrinomonadaceae bacterium]|nr:GAF domain-containing protein [Pyrinomonadaceae bacterium]